MNGVPVKIELEHFDGDEVEVLVYHDYQPPERATREYPGCHASIQINAVVWRGYDMSERITDEEMQQIEAELWLYEARTVMNRQAWADERADAMHAIAREERELELRQRETQRGIRT